MPDVLKKPIFGLPRWAWLSILLAAVAIGLYLRHQRKLEEENGEGSEEGNVVSGPSGEIIEPPYEGMGAGGVGEYGGGSAGTEYEGGNSLGLEAIESRERREEETQNRREEREEASIQRREEREELSPVSAPGEYAPSAIGPESASALFIPETPSAGAATAKPKVNKNTKTATSGGGPPAKPGNGAKSTITNGNGKIIAGVAKGIALTGPNAGGGGGGGNNPPAQNNQGGAPQNNQQHPAAVNTGNKCVDGGVGGHTAPSGYHLFCQGGWIWRAPNS